MTSFQECIKSYFQATLIACVTDRISSLLPEGARDRIKIAISGLFGMLIKLVGEVGDEQMYFEELLLTQGGGDEKKLIELLNGVSCILNLVF